jgi:hypothetical protein
LKLALGEGSERLVKVDINLEINEVGGDLPSVDEFVNDADVIARVTCGMMAQHKSFAIMQDHRELVFFVHSCTCEVELANLLVRVKYKQGFSAALARRFHGKLGSK